MSYNEYSDYSETESDEECAPLQIAGWGTQKINKEGTTEVSVSMDGWASLIDPTVQIKSNGIGTGQLHRQGRNFKPVDEQLILDQRLGKPLPKGGLNGEKKKKKSKSGQLPPPPPPQQQQRQQQQYRAPKPLKIAPNRSRPPIQPGSSAWATDKLVETPFWEQPNGTSASKYATPSAKPPQQQPPQQQWGQQPPQQQWGQQPPQHQSQQPLGTMASKYATPAPEQPSTLAQTCQYQQQQQLFIPADPVKTPCLTFKIELAPGVTANLSVYANDNPLDVVNQFEKNHQLVMTEAAKNRFAERVALLLSQYV